MNQPVQRHNAFRDALHDVLADHGLAVRKEVTIGNAHRRPADIALLNLDAHGPTAVDLVVHHPLAPSASLTGDPLGSLRAAEEDKTRHSEPLCHAEGWLFTAMGWHPWGGVGPRGSAFLRRVEKLVTAGLRDWRLLQAVKTLRGRLSFALMAFIAKQLSASAEALSGDASPETPDAPPLGPLFSTQELASWDAESDQLQADPQLKPPPIARRRRLY